MISRREACRRLCLNPWRYLTEVPTILPEAQLPEQLLTLLPDRWAATPPAYA